MGKSLPRGFESLLLRCDRAESGDVGTIVRKFGAVGLACVVCAGCGPAARQAAPSHVATRLERDWLHVSGVHGTSAPVAHGPVARRLAQRLRSASLRAGAQVVSLRVYRLSEPAPALVLATGDPAGFLRHRLKPIVDLLAAGPHYLDVVDRSGARVLEWYWGANEGALGVRPGLEGCSPVVAMGWQNIPPCPVS